MATVGRPRTATILKLHSGAARHDPAKLRDDAAVNPGGIPEAMPWLGLDTDEERCFEWLCRHCVLKSVHSHSDSLLIAKLAKEIVASIKVEKTLRDYGPVMKHPKSGRPELQPYFYAAIKFNEQIRALMSELGFTPIARMKFAPDVKGDLPDARSWDDID